jgi:hypothetical protein
MNIQSVRATVSEPTLQYKIKMFHEQRPSETWYSSHGLLTIKEIVQIVHLDFGITEDRLLGPYFLSPCLTGALYHDFL